MARSISRLVNESSLLAISTTSGCAFAKVSWRSASGTCRLSEAPASFILEVNGRKAGLLPGPAALTNSGKRS
ncbi:MAG TPA: hypothetical protein VGY99_22675 [Candidatus Binataceae bacterium]|nr:hypothetical protein [Candidatus Binataceae bacterium]